MVIGVDLNLESDFLYQPRNADEVKGTTRVNMQQVNATFQLTLYTKLDEVTGDYYPFLDIARFGVARDDDKVAIYVDGPSDPDSETIKGIVQNMIPMF